MIHFLFHQSLALRDVFPLAADKPNMGEEPREKRGWVLVYHSLTPPSLFCNKMISNSTVHSQVKCSHHLLHVLHSKTI